MKIVKPSIDVTFWLPERERGSTNRQLSVEEAIERAARTCYKSEDRITPGSARTFVRTLRNRGHHAMLEFGMATAHIIADRGCSHELVRHRLASYAQESTRFCNYSKGKFGGEITVVDQGLKGAARSHWVLALEEIERRYMVLLDEGVQPQIARAVLPICLKTEVEIAANTREWRHIFSLRCSSKAHPIIRGIMLEALRLFADKMPALYEDLAEKFLKDSE